MFTEEFIIRACEYHDREETAGRARSALARLGINNVGVKQELDTVIAAAKAYNMIAVNYIYSFVPEELRILLKVTRVTGAFATSRDGKRFSLNASIRLHLESGVLDLSFDNKNKCLYTNGFFSNSNRDKYFEEISKHIKPEPKGFNAWIVITK